MVAAVLATAVASLGLVAVTGPTVSAAPVSTAVKYSCGARGGDAATASALELASAITGSNRLGINVTVSAADIPERAGLEQDINAQFTWTASLDQALIDGAAGLIPQISITNIKGSMNFTGPASETSFSGTGQNTVVRPDSGQNSLNLGTYGGPITTTGGGIISYRVATLEFDSQLRVGAPLNQNFDLKLACSVVGSNLVAKTSVRDPDAPLFEPEVIALDAAAGETVTVDLLGDVITEGKTPLLPETLRVAEEPAAGSASITGGVFSFTAPAEPGVYSTTVEVCGAPKPDGGAPGIDEVQQLTLGDNWGGNLLSPRPVAFSLKLGDEETPLIWTAERGLFPGLPLPLGDMPTPENWAPENRAGLVNEYALFTNYKAPTTADITRALEALPSVGAGNVQVDAVTTESGSAGFSITYVNERAEQDLPDVALGQWYSVPPQEVLDRLSAAIDEVLAGLGGEGEDGGEVDPGPTPGEILGGATTIDEANAYIGNKLVASITGGPPVTDEEWEAWQQFLVDTLLEQILVAVPEILAFINGLFPTKLFPETLTQGEEPTPAPQLCAQGIIDVTVSEVAEATATPVSDTGAAQVGGIQQTAGDGQGIGFVG